MFPRFLDLSLMDRECWILFSYEEQVSVPRNFLVGIHNPYYFSMHMVSMNLWKEMQRREEEWKEEKCRLKKEIQKRDEEIEDKKKEIVALKGKVDNIVALVP